MTTFFKKICSVLEKIGRGVYQNNLWISDLKILFWGLGFSFSYPQVLLALPIDHAKESDVFALFCYGLLQIFWSEQSFQ